MDFAADWVTFSGRTMVGESEEAFRAAEQIIAESSDPFQVSQALIELAAMHYGAKHWDALLPLMTRIEEQLHAAPQPRLIGLYQILAGAIAYERRSYGIALLHLVEAERALQRMDERTRAAVEAWHDLAAIYSKLGYHARALEAAQRCQSLSTDMELPAGLGIAVYAYVQAAVVLDQRGDTAHCVRDLTEVVERCRPFVADLIVMQLVLLRYAVQRLAALDHPIALDVPVTPDPGPHFGPINTLGDVCDALAIRRPHEALAILDTATKPLDTLGMDEPVRLRSLAMTQLGEHAAALAAERAVLLRANQEEYELRRLLTAAAGARLDQDELRRNVERQTRAALTDPLTGLPNRRKVNEFIAELSAAGKTAIVAMLDLDRFKAINDHHGHPTGDIVLQRVAGVLAREARPTDLVARPGGDEFVVVLPDTSRSEAEAFGEKIEAAIRGEDWPSLVPGTPVAISIGWAELTRDVDAAFRAADAALYATKRVRRSRRDV